MAEAAIGRRMLGELEETSLDEISREVNHEFLSPISVGRPIAVRPHQILQHPKHPSLTRTRGHEIADPRCTQILSIFRTSLNSTSLNQGGSSPTAGIPAATASHVGPPGPSSSKVKSYPIQDLDRLVAQHFRATQSGPLCLSGRHLPLIYLLVATLIAAPHNKAVVVIDIDARFDITRVAQCTPHQAVPVPAGMTAYEDNDRATEQQKDANQGPQSGTDAQSMTGPARQVPTEDLKHVHVWHPARGSPSYIREVLSAAEHQMIYSKHASTAREWWGSIVIGGGSPAVLGPEAASVTTGWRGWLRVDREEVRGFGLGMSIEEALLDRDRRQRAVNEAGWTASCVWGGFTFDGTQTMYIEKLNAPIEDDPPAFGGYRGEKRALAVLAVRLTHNLLEVSQPAESLRPKVWGIEFATIPSSPSPGDLERGYEETIPPRARSRVNTEHIAAGRPTFGVDLDSFENPVQQ